MIITMKDIFEFLRKPICLFVLSIIISYFAFQNGIEYARRHVEVHALTKHTASIEIAGETHLYTSDLAPEETILWSSTKFYQ